MREQSEFSIENSDILGFHENTVHFIIGFPIVMKMFPKSTTLAFSNEIGRCLISRYGFEKFCRVKVIV